MHYQLASARATVLGTIRASKWDHTCTRIFIRAKLITALALVIDTYFAFRTAICDRLRERVLTPAQTVASSGETTGAVGRAGTILALVKHMVVMSM